MIDKTKPPPEWEMEQYDKYFYTYQSETCLEDAWDTAEENAKVFVVESLKQTHVEIATMIRDFAKKLLQHADEMEKEV